MKIPTIKEKSTLNICKIKYCFIIANNFQITKIQRRLKYAAHAIPELAEYAGQCKRSLRVSFCRLTAEIDELTTSGTC